MHSGPDFALSEFHVHCCVILFLLSDPYNSCEFVFNLSLDTNKHSIQICILEVIVLVSELTKPIKWVKLD